MLTSARRALAAWDSCCMEEMVSSSAVALQAFTSLILAACWASPILLWASSQGTCLPCVCKPGFNATGVKVLDTQHQHVALDTNPSAVTLHIHINSRADGGTQMAQVCKFPAPARPSCPRSRRSPWHGN